MATIVRRLGIVCTCGLLFTLFLALPIPAQSKGSLKIVFQVFSPKEGFNLGFSRLDGTERRKLTDSNRAIMPSFSADGDSLFFAEFTKTDLGMIPQIFQLDLKTNERTQLSDGSANDEYPRCSPDGQQLAFITWSADRAKKDQPKIYLMDLQEKKRTPLDPEGDSPQLYPSWSPDGTKVVYAYLKVPLAVLKIRDLEKKTTDTFLPKKFYATEPSWSPLGDQIAFTAWDPKAQSKTIWVVKVDGSDPQQITQGPDDGHPAWFPDGRKLVFSHAEGQDRVICEVDLATKKVKTLIKKENAKLEFPRIHQ
ncbi:MAG: hypothetical protein PHW74_03910 [Desulfobacca sp.]|nr:hypothetical protein [Desulfobacca sp.]